MVSTLRFLILVLCVVVFAAPVCAQEIPNWPAPATWTPAAEHGRLHTMAAVTSPLPFIGVTPCRLVDTRGTPGVPINTGGAFAANEVRTWTFTGLCGLPSSAAAVSLNITVTNTGASPFGFVNVWPGGGTEPNVSTLNWSAGGLTVSNAAIVPLGTSPPGSVSLRSGNAGSDVIVDVNGYYGSPAASSSNVFLGPFAGNATMTGAENVGIGYAALLNLTSGSFNTATGQAALLNNKSGFNNTASGSFAMVVNQVGSYNTAIGESAMQGSINSNFNTAVGSAALQSNVDGNGNVAIGRSALANIATSVGNIAIGFNAAANLTSGGNNIHIGNPALSSESNTIRIGTGDGVHTKFFVAGVRGVTTGFANALGVLIDSGGQLGTISSSARVKRKIADVGEESSALLRLRPVSFLYRNDAIGFRQYGLIAEEVAAVMPELVQFSEAGEPEAVRYHFLPPLLLRELQKQQKTIEQQNETIAGLEARLARLEARLSTESGR